MRVCLCVLAMAMAVRARTLKALHGARSCVGHGSGPPHAIRPIPIGVLVKTCAREWQQLLALVRVASTIDSSFCSLGLGEDFHDKRRRVYMLSLIHI